MATKNFHSLMTTISHDGLSSVTQKILGITGELFTADHPLVGPAVKRVQSNHAGLKQSMTRKSGSVYTLAINHGYMHSFNCLVALRYLLRLRLKQTDTPEGVKVAQEVKTALVMSGVWKYENLSHQHLSSFIANTIEVLSIAEIQDKLTALGAIDAFNALVASRQRCAALEAQRIDEQAADDTPRIKLSQGRLLGSLNTLQAVVALGAETDPASFAVAAEQIDAVVREANAVTRSGKTRKANAAEAEQAEAATAGTTPHTTFPPEGAPVTSITLEAGPPAGKEGSTA